MSVVSMHQVDDLLGDSVQVEDWRVCVQAGGVKLVAVLHGQFSKRSKVFSSHCFDHLLHPVRNNRLCTVLHTSFTKIDCYELKVHFNPLKKALKVTFNKPLVCTLVCIPEVLPIGFLSALAWTKTNNTSDWIWESMDSQIILDLCCFCWTKTYHKYKDSEFRPVTLWLHLLG